MNQTAIFWPMIAHAALVFGIYVLMFLRRKAAVQAGSIRISDFRENRNEPAESLFVRNSLANQFELPVLFHAVCLALYATAGANVLAVVLAWVFVLSRYLHAFIHITTTGSATASPPSRWASSCWRSSGSGSPSTSLPPESSLRSVASIRHSAWRGLFLRQASVIARDGIGSRKGTTFRSLAGNAPAFTAISGTSVTRGRARPSGAGSSGSSRHSSPWSTA